MASAMGEHTTAGVAGKSFALADEEVNHDVIPRNGLMLLLVAATVLSSEAIEEVAVTTFFTSSW